MVILSEVSLAYGEQVVLDEVSLSVEHGVRIALCGANGSGKSSLLKIIAGHVRADQGRVIPRRGVRIGYLPQSGIAHHGRTLQQELELAFADELGAERELRRVEEELAETEDERAIEKLLDRYGRLSERVNPDGAADRAARRDRVRRGLGFRTQDADNDTATFSSGWQMRLALAKLLLQRPDLLLLDEPSNYLDLEARQWLEGYLRSYPGAYLLVAHDRMLMDRTCDQVAEIYRGKLRTYPGTFSEYLQRRELELDQMAELYERQQEEIARMDAFVRKFRANSSKARMVQSRIKYLERLERLQPPPVQAHIAFTFPPAPKGGRRALSAHGLRLAYGEQQVIDGLELELDRGERLALVGENGVGKSTLLRALAGVMPAQAGQVSLGTGVTVGYFAQDRAEQLTGTHSVLEDVEELAPTDLVPRVRNLLGAFLFSGDAVFKPLAVLSGGERSRVALVRLLLQPANLLLLDEPTSHLDLSAIHILTQALRRYAGTLVFASHDEYFIAQLATKVLQVTSDRVQLYHGDWDYYCWKRAAAVATGSPAGSMDGRSMEGSSPAGGLQAAGRSGVGSGGGGAGGPSGAGPVAVAAGGSRDPAWRAGDNSPGNTRRRGTANRRNDATGGEATRRGSAAPQAAGSSRGGTLSSGARRSGDADPGTGANHQGGRLRRGEDRRNRSRARSEARARATLQRREQELLTELDRLQAAERRLQGELSDPAVYTDGDRVRELKRQLAANSAAQHAASAAWEEVEQSQHRSDTETEAETEA